MKKDKLLVKQIMEMFNTGKTPILIPKSEIRNHWLNCSNV
jgi:hypothetical protein